MYCKWSQILHKISITSFTHAANKIAWKWKASGMFSMKSLYNFLNFGGVKIARAMLW